jgi:hypothetical protein
MAQIRERGIYAFRTPPGGQGVLTGWYRTKLEQGDMESVQRSIRYWDVTQHEPYFPFLDTDLSIEAHVVCACASERIPDGIDKWMIKEIEGFTPKMMDGCEAVYDKLGAETVQRDYCPVAWASASHISRKELIEAIRHIVEVSGRPSVPYYYVAVSDESFRQYGVSMPVVWMRRSFLRTFKEGNDRMNIYRMMGTRITEKYDIPAYREEEINY